MKARYLCIRGCTYTMYTGCCTCRYDAGIGWISTSLGVGDAPRHEATRAYNERLGVVLGASLSSFPSPPRLPFCVRRRRRPLALERHRILSSGDFIYVEIPRATASSTTNGAVWQADVATPRRGDLSSPSSPRGYDTPSPRIRTCRIARGSFVSRFSPFQLPDSRFLRPHAIVSFPLSFTFLPARKITLDPDSDTRENFQRENSRSKMRRMRYVDIILEWIASEMKRQTYIWEDYISYFKVSNFHVTISRMLSLFLSSVWYLVYRFSRTFFSC